MNEVLLHLGIAQGVVCAIMAITFFLARRWNNYGIVDVVWSWGFIPVAGVYVAMNPDSGQRGMLLLAMVCLWSSRLGWHLFVRVKGHHPEEDGRYAELRRAWEGRVERKMFEFFQLQALVLVLLSLPFLLTARNGSATFSLVEWMGGGLFLLALLGEASADAQLNRFKANSANRGKTCRSGWWRYSRHPNYFFEWLIWVSFATVAWAAPWGWLGILSPALILWFLLKVTGIPATEEQALRSRGEEYRDYQKTTSAFVPWFPKETS